MARKTGKWLIRSRRRFPDLGLLTPDKLYRDIVDVKHITSNVASMMLGPMDRQNDDKDEGLVELLA